jgi:transposase
VHGVGRPLAARLLADGETVVDVPAKLAPRVRLFDTGQGRKTDATDAHAVVMVALRIRGLRQLVVDEELASSRRLHRGARRRWDHRVSARSRMPSSMRRIIGKSPSSLRMTESSETARWCQSRWMRSRVTNLV